MNTRRTLHTGLVATLLLAGFSATAWADKEKERGRDRGDDDGRRNERVIHVDKSRGERPERYERNRHERDRDRRVERPAERPSGNGVFTVHGPLHSGRTMTESPYRGRDPRGIVIEGGRRHIPAETHTHYQSRGWVIDKRYNHNHYYPPRGHAVKVLPPRHHVVHYHHVPYYFHAGVWYRSYDSRFVVTLPPIGVRIRVLPDIYTTIWVGGVPYYYAGGVYYTWHPQDRVYVVSNPPSEVANVSSGNGLIGNDQLYIYPKQGQSEQQQAQDRYECHRWGVSQTNFDPTLPQQNLSVSEQNSKRMDYRRAMKACLEGRGYSVQ